MSKYFCFTIWGPSAPKWQPLIFRYLTFQREKGEKRGRPHYQGMVVFDFPMTLDMARAIIKNDCPGLGYFMPARSLQAAIRYCHKQRSRSSNFVEFGSRPHK